MKRIADKHSIEQINFNVNITEDTMKRMIDVSERNLLTYNNLLRHDDQKTSDNPEEDSGSGGGGGEGGT
jgi:hypothetical protein